MSENRAIGLEGKIPWHLPLDFQWFKRRTMGGALIMGRKTFESLKQPLPGRETFVLSRRPGSDPSTKTYGDVGRLFLDLPPDKPVWVVGGSEIYRELLPLCGYLYLTRIRGTITGDTFFPPFEDQFSMDQVIHENGDFRVERWLRHGATPEPPEAWPFA